jgi:hypothetical protein
MTKLYEHLCALTKEKRIAAVEAGAAPELRFHATLLGTIVSDLTPVGKAKEVEGWEPADVDVIKKIKAFSDGVEESLAALNKISGAENDKRLPQLRAESALLSALLGEHRPKQMSSDELEVEIKRIIDGLPKEPVPQMGQVMNALKRDFAGQFDGKTANALAAKALPKAPKKAG